MGGESHFRRAGRKPLSLRLRFRAGSALEHAGRTSDLGLGGAFIETSSPPLPGSHVTILLTAPTAWDPLELDCEVRWASDGRDGRTQGFGVRFEDLTKTQAAALHELLHSLGYLENDA